MNLLSLFSGSGQLDRSVEAALAHFGIKSRIVCYVEENKACQEVIRARIRDGLLQDAPIWPDVVTFSGRRFRGYIDGIVAGFPCQPFSVAGKKLGTADERYLFGDVIRIADESGCELLFLENTPGLLIPDSRRPDEPAPISDVSRLMAQSGFDCAWLPVSASDVGSPHGRERWWCCAWRTLQRGTVAHATRTSER
jgi:DNA (cytosine-5)-methyltransferase 1